MAINPKQLGQQLVKKQEPNYKRVREVDDFQASEFPDVTTKEFLDGYLKGDPKFDFKYDTAANDALMDYISQDLKMSPRQWNETVKTLKSPRRYSDEYIKKWETQHDSNGNPIPRRSDIQVWRDRAMKIPVDKFPVAVEELSDEQVQAIIDALGFDRRGEW